MVKRYKHIFRTRAIRFPLDSWQTHLLSMTHLGCVVHLYTALGSGHLSTKRGAKLYYVQEVLISMAITVHPTSHPHPHSNTHKRSDLIPRHTHTSTLTQTHSVSHSLPHKHHTQSDTYLLDTHSQNINDYVYNTYTHCIKRK